MRRLLMLFTGLFCMAAAGGLLTTQIATAQSTVLYKNPWSVNLFIGGEPIVINEEVVGIPEDQGLGEFEFGLLFDPDLVNVSISEGPFLGSTGRTTSCAETVVSEIQVNFSCESSGTQPGPTGAGLLALITVSPAPDLVFRPSANNGAALLLVDLVSEARLLDTSGEPVPVNEAFDSLITVRALEADLNQDCVVNVIDDQLIAVRFLAVFGSLDYDPFFDLEPGFPDGDIDIKDLQFVFGRDGSTCPEPIPPQPPLPTPSPVLPTPTPGTPPAPTATPTGTPPTATPTSRPPVSPPPGATLTPTATTPPAATATPISPTPTHTPVGAIVPVIRTPVPEQLAPAVVGPDGGHSSAAWLGLAGALLMAGVVLLILASPLAGARNLRIRRRD